MTRRQTHERKQEECETRENKIKGTSMRPRFEDHCRWIPPVWRNMLLTSSVVNTGAVCSNFRSLRVLQAFITDCGKLGRTTLEWPLIA